MGRRGGQPRPRRKPARPPSRRTEPQGHASFFSPVPRARPPSARMSERLRSIARSAALVPGGRRTKFAVIAVWLVILFVIGPLAGKFEDAQENDPADYLPGNAESVKALDRLDGFPSDDQADAITVFHRDGGLTAEDKAAIERTRTAINDRIRPEINAAIADEVPN